MAENNSVFGHRLHELRRQRISHISQGQYWLAHAAGVEEKRLLSLTDKAGVSDVGIVNTERLWWPTKKIYKQMTPEILGPGLVHPGDRMRANVARSAQSATIMW